PCTRRSRCASTPTASSCPRPPRRSSRPCGPTPASHPGCATRARSARCWRSSSAARLLDVKKGDVARRPETREPGRRYLSTVTRSALALALASAALFGAATPASKWLLAEVPPLQLAGLLYLGAGLGGGPPAARGAPGGEWAWPPARTIARAACASPARSHWAGSSAPCSC